MTSTKNGYLMKNTVIFALGNFGPKLISFLLVPIYTNVLTTGEYGTVDLIQTLSMFLVPILTCNICESVMRFALDRGADYRKILSIGFFSLMMATILGLLIIPLTKATGEIGNYGIHLYFYAIAFAYSQMFLCYLRGKELLLQYAIGSILQTFCIAILNIIFLVGFHRGIEGYLEAYILAYSITAVYAFVVGKAYEVIGHFKWDRELSRQMFKFSVVLIPNSFMWWIMSSSDRLMLTAMVGVTANGLFAIAYRIPTLLTTITQVFNQAWSYSAIRERGEDDEERYSNAIFGRFVSIVMVSAAGIMLILKPFMHFYVGEEFYIAWRYTPVLLMGFVFSTIGTFLATSYTVHKDSMGYLKSGTAGAVVNIILNLSMIPVWGAMGAAIATSISYMTVCLYRVKDTRKYIHINIKVRSHVVGYILLMVQMFTIYIDTPIVYALLAFETLLIFFVHKSFFIDGYAIVKKVAVKFLKRQK